MAKAWLRTGETVLIDEEDLPILGGAYYYCRQLVGRTCYVIVGTYLDSGILKVESLHRLILRPPPGMVVDHINFNGLDNQRKNLRLATVHQNVMHRRKQKGDHSSSRYQGVAKNNSSLLPWRAYIHFFGRQIYLGCYLTEEDAAAARDKAATIYFGEFAHLNLPLGIPPA